MRAEQVEQGLGLGSGSPLFNRHVVSLTRFIKLRSPPPSSSSPPPVLVTHARSARVTQSIAFQHLLLTFRVASYVILSLASSSPP